ncbi:MAG: hypothetical protein ABIQ44_10865, partial [Chloroflexia bacterium]
GKSTQMNKTHLSLYYLIGYLIPSGLALLVPQFAFKLLFSNGNYGDVIPRLAGLLLLALSDLVFQIIRFKLEMLYTTLLESCNHPDLPLKHPVHESARRTWYAIQHRI